MSPVPSCHHRRDTDPHFPHFCPPQTQFPITPSCTHISQLEMLQGITVPVLGLHHRKPHGVGSLFKAQVVPLHAGLSSQKGQELLLSSSFYSIHKKIKISGSQMYKPSSKPQSMPHALMRGSKSTSKEQAFALSPVGGWMEGGIRLVSSYLISP